MRRQRTRERDWQQRRRRHIRQLIATWLDSLEATPGAGPASDLAIVGKAFMELMHRPEQIELLTGILRKGEGRYRDDALELICMLLPYAKPRTNAPQAEIAGVSMLDTVVRRSRGSRSHKGRNLSR